MIRDWWMAHRFEIFVDLGGISIVVLVIAAILIRDRWKARKARTTK